jgi:hypothetical protein
MTGTQKRYYTNKGFEKKNSKRTDLAEKILVAAHSWEESSTELRQELARNSDHKKQDFGKERVGRNGVS